MSTDTPQYDLVVIGAGIAGLNALFVATEYLPPTARALLVDRRDTPGGMWTDTYDYVRLHQPHGAFTVGDLPWEWAKPAGYLATGTEVQAHLTHCLAEIATRIRLETRFGTECLSIEEAGGGARIRLRAGDGTETQVEAARAVHAAGLDIPRLAPLTLSSDQVVSTAPGDLALTGDAPAYVVGGGKTGIDTALALIRANPGRQVTLLSGRGTVFANRDLTLPEGAPRYWRGHLLLPTFRTLSMAFDGTNADAVFEDFRDTMCIDPGGAGHQFLFGLLSEGENADLQAGLSEMVQDYLEDVIDTETGPVLRTRGGRDIAVAPGSVIVNCTGHVLRTERPYTPYLSPGGAVLTVTSRSAVHFLSSVAGYFLTHLWLSGQAAEAPLYELDLDTVHQIDRRLMHLTGVMHSFHNTIVFMDTLPFKVLDSCGLDLDRWFPLHRRMAALIDVKWNRQRYLDHSRAVLDRVADDHGLHCGRLTGAEAA